MIADFRLGDILQLKKPHPCGSDRWEVVRLGADIGIRCLGCGHRALIERPILERRIKAYLAIGGKVDTTSGLA